jgi:hypothetical protein
MQGLSRFDRENHELAQIELQQTCSVIDASLNVLMDMHAHDDPYLLGILQDKERLQRIQSGVNAFASVVSAWLVIACTPNL